MDRRSMTPLIERSLWWLLPAFVLSLFMVETMMQFTSGLIERRPRQRTKRVGAFEMTRRLLALDTSGLPYRIARLGPSLLEIGGYEIEEAWREGGARIKFTTAYRARMLADEERKELRWYESLRSSNLFLGFDGWIPRFHFDIGYQGGYLASAWTAHAYSIEPGFLPQVRERHELDFDIGWLKEEIARLTVESGWTFRPVTLPFYASPRWLAFTDALLPGRIRRAERRRLWTILYPGSFIVLMAYLIVLTGAWETRNLLLGAGIAAAWWGTWGVLVWLLVKLSNPGKQRRRRRRKPFPKGR